MEAKSENKQPLSPEQSVLIMSCLNEKVLKSARNAAKKEGVEVVILEDKVIYDYLDSKNKTKKSTDLSDFLNDTSNRLHAEEQANRMFEILTGGGKIDKSEELTFTTTEVVRKTNLSHSQTDSLLELFKVFGLIRFVKGGHVFSFNFSKVSKRNTIFTELCAMCSLLNNDIVRYKTAIENDDTLTPEEKEKVLKEMKKTITNAIKQ